MMNQRDSEGENYTESNPAAYIIVFTWDRKMLINVLVCVLYIMFCPFTIVRPEEILPDNLRM